MKQFFCDWLFSCAVAASPVPHTTPVPDLYYGTVLYAYYQDDTQQALLETLIAQTRGQIGADPVRLELAKGSFAFAERMYKMSEQTFDALDPQTLKPMDKMRLAFHLAREHFRRGEWDEAEAKLREIDLGTTFFGRERVNPEVEFMRAELAERKGDFPAARAAISRIDAKSPNHAYALFNLGVAERKSGDLASAAVTFRELSRLPAYSKEVLDLKQRALVALSVVKRAQNATERAEDILGVLPDQSRYRDLALTSYGGLAMDAHNYELAARVWLTLSKDDVWSESSAVARLALPMSLEQIASRQQALVQYRVTEATYEERLGKLNNLALKADDAQWVGDLLQVFALPDTKGEKSSTVDVDAHRRALIEEWRSTFGHTDWLEWLAGEDAHELLLEWRELKDIATWLDGLPDELTTFDGLAQEQRRRQREARERIASQGFVERRAALSAELDALHERIRELDAAPAERTEKWMSAFADDKQAKLLANLAAKRALAKRALPPSDAKPYLARIDRLEGMVFWDLAEARAAKLREVDKESRSVASLLGDVDTQVARVNQSEQNFAAGVQADFLGFQTRADAITKQVAVALADRQARLVEEIRGGIHHEVAQLERQLLITRMAIARATDQLAFSADSSEKQP